jgi:hypothetical protein
MHIINEGMMHDAWHGHPSSIIHHPSSIIHPSSVIHGIWNSTDAMTYVIAVLV